MKKILLKYFSSPGNTVAMTVVPRDIHVAYPGEYQVSVHTQYPDVFAHNPHVASVFGPEDQVPPWFEASVDLVPAVYPDMHLLRAMVSTAADELGLPNLQLTQLRPDLYLDPENSDDMTVGTPLAGQEYWVFNAGYRQRHVARAWDPLRWRYVTTRLATDESFPLLIQVGETDKGWHPRMTKGMTIRLVNRTSLPELFRLIYHSQGVITSVGLAMHVAAAFGRPCVTIAGGMDAWGRYAYDMRALAENLKELAHPDLVPLVYPHRYVDTVGRLPCCESASCGRTGLGLRGPEHDCLRVIKPQQGMSEPPDMPQAECMRLVAGAKIVGEVYKTHQEYQDIKRKLHKLRSANASTE